MKTNKITTRYLSGLRPVEFKIAPDYKQLSGIKPLLDAMSSILPHDFYVVDYYKKQFFYISTKADSPLLGEHTINEVLQAGYEIYAETMSEERIKELEQINNMAFSYFYQLSAKKRHALSIAHNLVLKGNFGEEVALRVQGKPFLFTPDNNIWMILFTFRPTGKTDMKSFIIQDKQTNQRHIFSTEHKTIRPLPKLTLSDREKFIAYETARGTLEKQLSQQLGITIDTIHYYKKRLMQKTFTTNIREAIHYLEMTDVI